MIFLPFGVEMARFVSAMLTFKISNHSDR